MMTKKFLLKICFVFIFLNTKIVFANTLQDQELYCLAQNIYFESRSESILAQYAVADVVLNRVNLKSFPNTICEVVKQGPVKESWKTVQNPLKENSIYYPVRNKCQFSWYCDGKLEIINDFEAWEKSIYVAKDIYINKKFLGLTMGSTHYHAIYVNPIWKKEFHFIMQIDSHLFYR